ncbi:P2Y purinoceptor 14-like [Maylandia zebra]|uniref:P2Y purinoceptor 14-like n=1 Tax=Maylandia zebra TaxID=106582 RepID=UPI00403CA480
MADSTNGTSSFNQTCDPVVPSLNTFFVLVYSLVFLVGLLLNGFILKFYIGQAQQQESNSLMVYLKNLTAADFLLCLSLPLRIAHYDRKSFIIQKVYCSFGASAFYMNMYASIIFMCYIAANRYLKIVHPSGTHVLQSVRTAHIISMVTWKPLTFTPSQCWPLFSASISLFFKILHTICAIIFLLVFISLVFFYHGISRRVLQAQQRQLASSNAEKLVKSRRNICSAGPVLFYLEEVATMVSVFNICLDPLVYFFLCKSFWDQMSQRIVSVGTNI